MSFRSLLLSSVAAVAFAAGQASASPAPASPSFHDWYLAVVGGPLFATPGVTTTETPVLDSPPAVLGQDHGGYGSVAFGHGIGDSQDWRLTLAYSGFGENSASSISGSDEVDLASKLSFATADFDVGFHRALANGDFRFFAGLRALAENDQASVDKVGSSSGFLTGTYAGLGPHIGADWDWRFANSPFGVSAGVAGSAIIGQRQVANNVSSTSSYLPAYNIEGQVALDYHPLSFAALSVGVRGAQWWNIRSESTDPSLASSPDLFSWGPFVKFTLALP